LREFVSGRLVSGGGLCEGCGKRLEEGEKVFALSADVDDIEQFLYCQECRPTDDELPSKVLSLQPAVAVEEIGADERFLGFEVKAGSRCSVCGHTFEEEEWLFVGVVEGLHRGFVYCRDCYDVECMSEE
jgi:hypothetical protein